jgi:plasmid stability protein
MVKVKTTLSLDADLVRRIRVRAARLGRRDADVYEEALREGLSAIDSLRRAAGAADTPEFTRLVDEAVHATRVKPRRGRASSR